MVMKMESSRRSFDRSREPGLKKPRLADEQPNPNGRPFPQRSSVALPPAAAAARYRVNSDRDSESNDSSRGGGAYQPQPQQYHELVSQYKTALAELTFNSKPIITNLTIIAGENLHVAKAIASTVCNNILEVPSDQKLPSLYLLDSIVKNIGRDYIKYFASRLPEVFCKAYRQVDSPVHQSMRHLFGTWKGVFPPQSLQMIEKELGFAPAANGSSSGAVTSRPESQSRRPQHSIHVNPKYLEIQRLQQSSREKGMANDLTVPLANPIDDVERPDRTASIVAGRPWDTSLKMHNVQRSQRETLNEPVQEKKIPAVYGNIEYNSDISRNSGLGVGRTVGRVAEQGQEKQWYDAGNSIPEPISGQRNGFSMKHGVPNYSTPKPSNSDLHLQSTQSIAGKSNNAVSSSWKNSEEEEFMWDMHSRLSNQDAVNLTINSKKEQWTHDGLEKLEFDNQLKKSQTGHEVVSRFDRETSSDSLSIQQKEQVSFGHRLSSPWQLRESHQTDVVMTPGNSIIHTGSEIEGYSAALGGLPLGGSSSMSRVTVRPHMGKQGSGFLANTFSGSTATFGQQRIHSLGVTSPSGQLPLLQKPPSPSFPGRYPRQQLQNSSEQDLLQSLSHPQLSGNLVHPNSRLGAPQKLQLESQIQNPAPEPVSKIGTPTLVSSAPDPSSSFIAETSAQSSASSLLAAVMKSGVLAKITTGGPPSLNLQDVGQIPSESSIQPPIPSGPPPKVTPSRKKVTSASTPVTEDDTPVTLSVSQKKEEQPPLPSGPSPSSGQTLNAVDKAPNLISNLLSSLVAKGLISASKSESLSTLPTQITVESDKQNLSVANPSPKPISALPVSSAIQNSSTKDKLSLPKADMVLQRTESENKGFIGLEFKSDVLRELHPPVINALFDDLHRCSICGLQFKLKERLDRHMEWHNWRKRTEPDGTSRVTRRWYADSDDWIAGKAGCSYEIESSAVTDEDEPIVLADENQCVCVLCGELFEDYYSQKRKKWMFKAALNLPLLPRDDDNIVTANKNVEGPIVHVNCISESSVHDLGLASAIEMDKDG